MATAGCQGLSIKASDHHRVLARIKMKLKSVWVTRSTRLRYNVGFWKPERFWVGSACLSTIGTKYFRTYWKMKAQTCTTNGYSQRTPAWINACEDVLGRRELQQQEWISHDTLRKVQKKRKERVLNNIGTGKVERGTQGCEERNKKA